MRLINFLKCYLQSCKSYESCRSYVILKSKSKFECKNGGFLPGSVTFVNAMV